MVKFSVGDWIDRLFLWGGDAVPPTLGISVPGMIEKKARLDGPDRTLPDLPESQSIPIDHLN